MPPDSSESELPFDARLGRAALQRGLIDTRQLQEALREQAESAQSGRPLPLAEILVRRRAVDPSAIRKLQEEVRGAIRVACRSCGRRYLIEHAEEGRVYRCEACGAGLTPETHSAGSQGYERTDAEALKELPLPEPVREALRKGARVLGKYAVMERIGTGGAAEVFRGYDLELGRTVALKFLRQASAAVFEQLKREAQITARLQHPAIAQVIDFIGNEGEFCIVMQYIQGTTLDEARLPRRTILEVMVQVARAIEHAHRNGVIHRDIKPQNLMVEKGAGPPRVFVMDFGLAKAVEIDRKLSMTGRVLGTPYYMPPEQARGRVREIDARSDTYSLGATLYHLVTKRPPFLGRDFGELMQRLLEEDPPMPRKLDPTIERDLEAILLKALAKSKAQRYPTAGDLADDLERLLAGDPVTASRVSWFGTPVRFLRRRKLALAAGAAGLLVAAGAGFLALKERGRSDALAEERARADEDRAKSARMIAGAGDLRRQAAEMLYKEGFRYERYRKLLEDAIAQFGQALRLDPRSAEAHVGRGRAQAALGRNRAAMDDFRAALKIDDSFPAAHQGLGLALLEEFVAEVEFGMAIGVSAGDASKGDEAVRSILRASELKGPLSEEDRLALKIWAKLLANQPEPAAELCEEGKALRPEDEQFFYLAARAADLRKDLASVERNVQEALQRKRQYKEAHFLMGCALNRAGRHDQAEHHFSEAIRIDPEYFAPYLNRCNVRISRGRFPGALEDAQAAQRLDPEHPASAINLGIVRVHMGDERAFEDFTEAIRRDPRRHIGYLNRAYAWMQMRGDYVRGLEDLREAAKRQPENPLIHLNLSAAYLALGRIPEGLDAAAEAIRVAPNSPNGYTSRAFTLMKIGRVAEAEADLARALEIAPKDPEALAFTGLTESMRMRHAEAVERYDRSLEARPGSAKVLVWRARSLAPLGRFEEAERDAREALKQEPRNGEAYVALGQIFHNRGRQRASTEPGAAAEDLRAAVREYTQAITINPQVAGLAYLSRAVANVDLGDRIQARMDAREAMKLDPTLESQARQILAQVPE